jgi:exoribonuclease R
MNKEQIIENIKDQHIVGIIDILSRTKYDFYKKKLTYMFKPLNNEYPSFLVPFNKKNYKQNLFMVITFNDWKMTKLPIGTCHKVLGEVDKLEAEYDALLYKYNCDKKLIKLKQKIKNKHTIYNFMKKDEIKQYKKIKNTEIISIDPDGCLDIDDCLSYNKETQLLGIHIADPTFWLKKFDINITENYFSIYAPHKILNMIPRELSNHICSLKENEDRLSLTLWVQFKDGEINNFKYEKCIIKSSKSYSYDEAEKLVGTNELLTNLYELSVTIGEKYNYDILDWNTHKLIEVFMVMANNLTGKYMKNNNKNALFRTHESSNILLDENIPNKEVRHFLEIFQSNSAVYKTIKETNNYFHYGLKLDEYVTFTSPIRRYADMIVHKIIKNELTENLTEICEKINKQEKNTKKLYREFNKLKMISEMNDEYIDAFIINFDENNKINIYIPQYKVYDSIPIEARTNLSNAINDIITCSYDNNNMIILNNENNKSLVFSKYEKIKLSVFYINQKIQYEIINKNLNSLF